MGGDCWQRTGRREQLPSLTATGAGKPSTTTCPDTQHRVRELAEGRYTGFNHTHLTEMLAEREDIHLSRSTVRRVLLAGGLPSPRRRKATRLDEIKNFHLEVHAGGVVEGWH